MGLGYFAMQITIGWARLIRHNLIQIIISMRTNFILPLPSSLHLPTSSPTPLLSLTPPLPLQLPLPHFYNSWQMGFLNKITGLPANLGKIFFPGSAFDRRLLHNDFFICSLFLNILNLIGFIGYKSLFFVIEIYYYLEIK